MMYFSVGILYSAQRLLKYINENPSIVKSVPDLFKSINTVASPTAIFEICQICEWLKLEIDGCLVITDKGSQILETPFVERSLRIQLHHLLDAYKPTWIPLLTKGRSEALRYLPMDVVQCLRDADLTTSYSDDVILWWDKVSKISRKTGKDDKLEIGRTGEKLSINFERQRTNSEPRWQGFESNYSGYDVLSIVATNDTTPLKIEVKTSNSQFSVASLHISRNEWNVAINSGQYLFYLWALLPQPRLYIVHPDVVGDNIPNNRGEGEWESVTMPFSAICTESNCIT